MPKPNIVQQILQKQLAMNSGDISLNNSNGQTTWVTTSTGQPLSNGTNNATNFILGGTLPPVYPSTTSTAQVYNYAKTQFTGPNVPESSAELMANLATYYIGQTGASVQGLFVNGVLSKNFMLSMNTIRSPGSQLGFTLQTLIPNWTNNPILAPALSSTGN
jgi:hypothetical protein